MTEQDALTRVAEIEACKYDAESAHGLEDMLWLDVLRAIANGAANAKELAAAALRTQQIDFPRWCA